MYRATQAAGCLALPGALLAPRTLAAFSVAACAISLLAGSNAVISLILSTCEHNNFSFRRTLSRPPKELQFLVLCLCLVSRVSCVSPQLPTSFY